MKDVLERLDDPGEWPNIIGEAIEEIKRLRAVAVAAQTIYTVANGVYKRPPVVCPHGNSGYTSAWFCDECFEALRDALDNWGQYDD